MRTVLIGTNPNVACESERTLLDFKSLPDLRHFKQLTQLVLTTNSVPLATVPSATCQIVHRDLEQLYKPFVPPS